MDYLSYYFIAGDYRQVIDGYTQVSGRPAMLAKKWLTVWRDVNTYSKLPMAEITGLADKWRSGKFPMDVVRMDAFYDWGKFGWETHDGVGWDAGLPAVARYYRDKGFLFGGMVNGFGCKGCCVTWWPQRVDGNPGGALMEDSAHAAYAVDHGFDFAWYDCMTYHNRAKAQAEYKIWKAANHGDETKTIVADGWFSISAQSFPSGHTGDGLWDNPYAVFPASLEQSIAGYPYNSTDLGEGNAWNYVGCAMRPIISHHPAGSAGGDYRAQGWLVWQLTADVQNVLRKWENFHYRFIPYFFTYNVIASQTGMPIWRAMFCHEPKNTTTYPLDKQCYVGEDIIISPYYPDGEPTGGIRKGIYLPSGTWYDYFTGTKYTGPTKSIDYPCNPDNQIINYKLPMFVRAGAIIPLMDTMQYIGAEPETLLTVQTWPSNGTTNSPAGSFTLYEDEGVWDPVARTRAPLSKTVFATTFTDDGTNQQANVSIGAFGGSKYCATPAMRKYQVEIHNMKPVLAVNVGTTRLSVITPAQYLAGTTGFYWSTANGGVCYINPAGNAATGFTVYATTDGIPAVGTTPALAKAQKVVITHSPRSLTVSVPFEGNHVVELMTIQGRIVARHNGNGTARYVIPLNKSASSLYMLKISANGQTVVRRVLQ